MKTQTQPALRLLAALMIGACGGVDDDAENGDPQHGGTHEVKQSFVYASEIDPATGEPVATNFPKDEEFTYVEGTQKNIAQLSSIDEPRTVGNVELEFRADPDFALTAIGVRAKRGAVTTIWARSAFVRPNGWLGTTSSKKVGEDVPTPEVWCEAPDGYLIVGVGGRIADGNVTNLVLRTYQYNPATRELQGNPFHVNCGGTTMEQWVFLNDYALLNGVKWWQVAATGVGFRENNDNLDRVRLYYGDMY